MTTNPSQTIFLLYHSQSACHLSFVAFFTLALVHIHSLLSLTMPSEPRAIVETDTHQPAPHLKSNVQNGHVPFTQGNEPDYLRMILTSRVYDIVQETPLQETVNLNGKLNHENGAKIYIKREDLQPVFSFKIRGAYNKMAHLTPEEKAAGVIACSAGKTTR